MQYSDNPCYLYPGTWAPVCSGQSYRDNVAPVIEVPVNVADENADVWVGGVHSIDALRGGNEGQHANVSASRLYIAEFDFDDWALALLSHNILPVLQRTKYLLQAADCLDQGAAGGQHWVQYQRHAIPYARRELQMSSHSRSS